MYIYIYMYVCMYVCIYIYVCMYVCLSICLSVCMYMYICIYTHTLFQTWWFAVWSLDTSHMGVQRTKYRVVRIFNHSREIQDQQTCSRPFFWRWTLISEPWTKPQNPQDVWKILGLSTLRIVWYDIFLHGHGKKYEYLIIPHPPTKH